MGQELQAQGHYPRVFHEWGIAVTLVKAENGAVYFPVRQVCEGLGIDAHRQLARLNSDPDTRNVLVDIRVPTAGGMQKMACLPTKEIAWWLVHLDDARCRPDIRGHLQEIKQALMSAADRVLFGDIERLHEGERGVLALSSRSEYVIACLDCGARHRLVILNGEPSITLERER
jgi:hypothetical protein